MGLRRAIAGICLIEKCPVDGDRPIQRGGDALEGAGQAGKEGGVRTNQDNLDPDHPSMGFRQAAWIVGDRGGDNLLDGCADTTPAVQNAFDRRRADPGAAGDLKESGLRNLGSPLSRCRSLASRIHFQRINFQTPPKDPIPAMFAIECSGCPGSGLLQGLSE